jgi:hypothetical protein
MPKKGMSATPVCLWINLRRKELAQEVNKRQIPAETVTIASDSKNISQVALRREREELSDGLVMTSCVHRPPQTVRT